MRKQLFTFLLAASAAMGGFGAQSASAACEVNIGTTCEGECTVNTGTCNSTGTCAVNTGRCDGSCDINTGNCHSTGLCNINTGICSEGAPGCLLNLGKC